MPEDDIYNSKRRYESFVKLVENGDFLLPPEKRKRTAGTAKYYCRYKDNIKYFYRLFDSFEAQDLSYIRMDRILCNFRLICYMAEKDLAKLEREYIDKIAAYITGRQGATFTGTVTLPTAADDWTILGTRGDQGLSAVVHLGIRYTKMLQPNAVRALAAEPYAALRPKVARRYFVPIAAALSSLVGERWAASLRRRQRRRSRR